MKKIDDHFTCLQFMYIIDILGIGVEDHCFCPAIFAFFYEAPNWFFECSVPALLR